MYNTTQQAFILLAFLLFILSCGSTKTATKRLNDRYTNIDVKQMCNCTSNEIVEHIGRYRPPLSFWIDNEEFNRVSNWTLNNAYENIYSTQLKSGLTMKILATDPIIVTHKDKALTLNFTPCTYKNKFYIIPYFGINIERDEINYPTEDFDYTAFAYFDYLTAGTNMYASKDPQILLKEIIERQFYWDDSKTSIDFKNFINKIDTNYHTTIPEYDSNYLENGSSTIDVIIQELENAPIDISEFIVKEFVLTENTHHKINEEEKSRLRNITDNREKNLFKKIDFLLKNRLYNGHLSGNNEPFIVSVEISTNILRKVTPTTLKPQIDPNGNEVAADILVYSDRFEFSNFRQDKMVVDSLCTSISEITGTGILLEFDKAQLIFPPKIMDYNYNHLPINIMNNPLLKGIPENKTEDYENGKIDGHFFSNFMGLTIPYANLTIPIKGYNLIVKGKDLIINNQLIAGAIEIKKLPNPEIGTELVLVTDKSPIKISLDDLKHHLKRIGLEQIEITINEDSITVFFIKNRT